MLAAIAPFLLGLGYDVEAGKKQSAKVRRPVLFGEGGRHELEFQIDAFHDGDGLAFSRARRALRKRRAEEAESLRKLFGDHLLPKTRKIVEVVPAKGGRTGWTRISGVGVPSTTPRQKYRPSLTQR